MENYQLDSQIKHTRKKYTIVQDFISLDDGSVGKEDFIFDKLPIKGGVVYFHINSDYYKKYNNKTVSIGFWHTIMSNQPELFDFDQSWQYQVEAGDKILLVSYVDGSIDTRVLYKSSADSVNLELGEYKKLKINIAKYKIFDQVKTPSQKLKDKKT